MADSLQTAPDAGVPVNSYEGEGKQQQARASAKPVQPSAVSRKATLSAYMTIAAAAFGLISDGCMCQIFSIVKGFDGSETLCSADQNNLMTMSNVS